MYVLLRLASYVHFKDAEVYNSTNRLDFIFAISFVTKFVYALIVTSIETSMGMAEVTHACYLHAVRSVWHIYMARYVVS